MKGRWDQLILTARHLAGALELGLPLHEAVGQLRRESSDRRFRRVLVEIEGDLDQGRPLDEAMGRHPGWFGSEVVCRVRIGRQAGRLPEALAQTAEFLQRSFLLQQRLKRALIYPATVSALVVLDLMLVGIFVLPRLQDYYSSLANLRLALPTRAFIAMNSPGGYATVALAVFLIVGGMGSFLSMAYNERSGWHRFDPLRFHLPFWGPIQRQVEAVRFCRPLALLLRGGVSLPEALRVLEDNASGQWLQQRYGACRKEIEQGKRLGEGLRGQGFFPPTLLWTLATTEHQGKLVEGLEHLADFYQEKLETDLAIIREALEPILIVLVGLLVAVIVTGLYYPVFQITKVFEMGGAGGSTIP